MTEHTELDAARDRLATLQQALLQALAGGAAAPEGFDADRVRLASATLEAKRMRSAARAWPALATALGPSFGERFSAFATRSALPARGGALADGLMFWRSFHRSESPFLGDAARVELLAATLRYRRTGGDGSLAPRRGPSIAAAWLRESRLWVLAIRLPGWTERWLSVPLGPGR